MKLQIFLSLCMLPIFGFAQKQLSEEEVISIALKNSSLLNASSLAVTQSKQLQKTGFNLSNPEIMMESPSGEFQTVGVLQSINFPTVYVKQWQLLKQQTLLSEVGRTITVNDIKYQIKSLYLNIQYLELILKHYGIQDSMYHQIWESANRQYAAGQLDYLEKTFSDLQYGDIHNRFIQIQTDLMVARSQLQTYTGLTQTILTTPLQKFIYNFKINKVQYDSSSISGNPYINYYRQQQMISKKTLSLERNKFLPGFTFGYLNQGARNTPTDLRIRGGINIPLWFWQYSGNISAAKTGLKIAEQNTIAQKQILSIEMQKAQGDYLKYSQTLQFYDTIGLRQTDDIITTSKRFFEGGNNMNFISYMRNIIDAYNIKLKYLESLKNYNQAILTINYLSGEL